MKKLVLLLSILALFCTAAFASDGNVIKLPEPEKSGGIGVLDAIAKRQSAGDFDDVEITLQQLSTLLWVAAGVNRDNGNITFPTAMNLQDIIIYAFTRDGVYRYNPSENTLTTITTGDHRILTGNQPFVPKAAVDLLYVQDAAKWGKLKFPVPADAILNCGFSHAGFSMQNVYLYAASQGWGARARMNFDKPKLTELLGLNENYNFTLMICVGPKP